MAVTRILTEEQRGVEYGAIVITGVYLYYKNKNWLQLLFIVKAAVLKQQISKFYAQILSTEDSFYIYERPLTEINVIASFCA